MSWLLKAASLRGIGPTVPMATLWLGSMAVLLGGLVLDCSEFSATIPGRLAAVGCYFLSAVGVSVWLYCRLRGEPEA